MTPSLAPLTRQRRPTLLIVGCGDVGMRVLRLLRGRHQLLALTSSASRCAELRAAGAAPLLGNLDQPATLGRLAGLADLVLHLAPPPSSGDSDPRTAALLKTLARGGRVQRLVYASTSGVYGDCGGERVSETRNAAPATPRALRRLDAEARVRHFCRQTGCAVSILRVPGIYAVGREGGHPSDRLQRGAPVLVEADDVYTNHIHADDLARACVLALHRALPQRVINVNDDTELRMGDYFDLAAELCGLPRPPRVTRAQAAAMLSPMQISFMAESRRLCNRRLKKELGLRLLYPTVREGLLAPDSTDAAASRKCGSATFFDPRGGPNPHRVSACALASGW